MFLTYVIKVDKREVLDYILNKFCAFSVLVLPGKLPLCGKSK